MASQYSYQIIAYKYSFSKFLQIFQIDFTFQLANHELEMDDSIKQMLIIDKLINFSCPQCYQHL
ncbi:hypothetical protein pb186bvf_013280 [Paramecium bursaria]